MAERGGARFTCCGCSARTTAAAATRSASSSTAREVPEAARQAVAAELGFAETVFVDDRERGELRIFTPEVELPLAGHPLVGTAWLLRERGTRVELLRPPAGRGDACGSTASSRSIAANPEWGPPFEFIELGSPAEVDALTGAPDGYGLVGVWAWIDDERRD